MSKKTQLRDVMYDAPCFYCRSYSHSASFCPYGGPSWLIDTDE